jgi:hypothetical protein
MIQIKYPRAVNVRSLYARQLRDVNDCIDAALRRGPVKQDFPKDITRLKGSVLDGQRKLVSYFDFDSPYLAVEPVELELPKDHENIMNEPFALTAHPFTKDEMRLINAAMPNLEPLLGDAAPVFRLSHWQMPGKVWDKGMGMDELYYQRIIDPLVVSEIRNLGLEIGDLVVDPACGTSRQLMQLKMAYPDLEYVAADLNDQVVEIANMMQPNIAVHHEDARTMSYLEPGSVALFIMSGLLNETVTDKADARIILETARLKARQDAYFIITGKTTPHFNSAELIELGLEPVLSTRWEHQSFFPFYVCLNTPGIV